MRKEFNCLDLCRGGIIIIKITIFSLLLVTAGAARNTVPAEILICARDIVLY